MDLFKEICMCTGGCVAFIGFLYFATKEIVSLIKKGAVKRHARAVAKDEKKRIEEEKEYAYKLYLKQKAEIKKELK